MGRSVSYPSGAVVAFDRFEPEDDFDDWEFQHYAVGVMSDVKAAYPSARSIKQWIGREDLALLANDHCYFGVSSYCGLVAIWAVVRGDAERPELAEKWLASIAPKFEERFGSMQRVGAMSNGQAVYAKKPGKPAFEDDIAGDRGHVVIGGLLCG